MKERKLKFDLSTASWYYTSTIYEKISFVLVVLFALSALGGFNFFIKFIINNVIIRNFELSLSSGTIRNISSTITVICAFVAIDGTKKAIKHTKAHFERI